MALTPVDEALDAILSSAQTLGPTESRPLLKALGCVLAEPVLAKVSVPPCDNSAMDGYALRSEDSNTVRVITQRIVAGDCGSQVDPGTAARIFTGAPIPPGADAVVMQEECEVDGDRLSIVADIVAGQNLRRQGQDIEAGDTVLPVGRRLLPQDIGVVASVGQTEVAVRRPLRVAILSTGDELVEPGNELGPGQIYNSNRYTLSALLATMGVEVIDLGIVPDSADETARVLEEAASRSDCVVSSGGVSVGEEDHVKAQVEKLGELMLWKLRIKPGKPLAFGRIADTPFFGLPGNPGAVFVTFNLLVRPFLQRCQGMLDVAPLKLRAAAAFHWDKPGSREEYVRVRVERREQSVVLNLHANQSSGVLSSASWGNGLAIIYPGMTVEPGDELDVLLLSELSS